MTLTRRLFVASFAGAGACLAADKGQAYPPEIKRYVDEATENIVIRLTDPAHQSWLPAPYNRAISRKSDFLIYSSDRSGPVQAYRLDLKNGQSHALTAEPDLHTASLSLATDDREFAFLAGRSLYLGRTTTVHAREVYRSEEGFDFGTGFSLSEDGLVSALVEQKPGMSRLRLITMRTGAAVTIVESADPISDPQPRPKRAGLLYRKADELWVVNYDGAQNRKLRIAPGGLGTALWSGDGRAVDYLNIPAGSQTIEQHSRVHARYKRGPICFRHQPVRRLQSQQRHQRLRGRQRKQSFAVYAAAGAVGQAGTHLVRASRQRSTPGNRIFLAQ